MSSPSSFALPCFKQWKRLDSKFCNWGDGCFWRCHFFSLKLYLVWALSTMHKVARLKKPCSNRHVDWSKVFLAHYVLHYVRQIAVVHRRRTHRSSQDLKSNLHFFVLYTCHIFTERHVQIYLLPCLIKMMAEVFKLVKIHGRIYYIANILHYDTIC